MVSDICKLKGQAFSSLVEELEQLAPEEVLLWVWKAFGSSVAVSSSFQTQSLPLLHMVSRVAPEMPILFIDTGFHFKETLTYMERLRESLGLRVRVLKPEMPEFELIRHLGEKPYQRDPDRCCYINKVLPMRRAMKDYDVLVAGVRRDQTHVRATFRVLHREYGNLLKVHPMLSMTREDIESYIETHALPPHPLAEKGYVSIGCAPCTQPVPSTRHEREGRWSGTTKTECGLHISPADIVNMVKRGSG